MEATTLANIESRTLATCRWFTVVRYEIAVGPDVGDDFHFGTAFTFSCRFFCALLGRWFTGEWFADLERTSSC